MHLYTYYITKVCFPMGAVIALIMVLVVPGMPTQIAKSYSCSSIASGGGTLGGSTSSGVSGSQGSCSTSSSSAGSSASGSSASSFCIAPNCDFGVGTGTTSSSSGGGSQSSCSESSSESNGAFPSADSFAQSHKGKCP